MGDSPAQRALIVHSRADRARVLARAAQQTGFAVRYATSRGRAFGAVRHWKPHLVMLDAAVGARDLDELCSTLKIRCEAGATLLLLASSAAVPDAVDAVLVEPVGTAVLARQLRLLSDLQQARRERDTAEAHRREQTAFFAAAAHDLRQPAQAVRLFLSALEPRVVDSGKQRLLAHAQEALASLEALLGTVMDMSAIEYGKLVPRIEPFEVAELIKAVGVTHAPEAARKGLGLRIRPGRAEIVSDRVMVERILRNLVVNAVRYTEKGGILVASRRKGGHALIEVWDTGVGIPEEQLNCIFEEFRRLDGGRGCSSSGLGLGLSVVARTALILGHEVSVRSRLGRGSVFRLRAPLQQNPSAAPSDVFSPTACAACPQ